MIIDQHYGLSVHTCWTPRANRPHQSQNNCPPRDFLSHLLITGALWSVTHSYVYLTMQYSHTNISAPFPLRSTYCHCGWTELTEHVKPWGQERALRWGAGFLYPLPKTHAQNHVTSLSQQSQQQDNDEALNYRRSRLRQNWMCKAQIYIYIQYTAYVHRPKPLPMSYWALYWYVFALK